MNDKGDIKRRSKKVRERGAAEMRANEEAIGRLAAIVSSSDDAIISKDLNGIITSWNAGAERLFGYKAKEVIGKSITILIPEDHLNEEPRILESIRRGEKVGHYETVRRRKDGKLLDVSLTVSPIKDPTGGVIGASKIARDITGRREIEAALRGKEAELRMVADTTPLVLVRCTRDLKYKFINLAGAALFGMAPNEMIGRTILDVMGKRGFAIVQPYIRTVLRGEPIEFEAEIPYPAVGPRWMRVSYEPERDEQDKVIGWLASIVDITEIKAAQETRREYEERFSRFMRNLPGLAWIKDLEGRYVYANHAALEAFQITRRHLYGKTDAEIFPPDIAESFRTNDQLALETGAAVENLETLIHKDGVLRYSLVTKFPMENPDGQFALIGGMAIDITERVKVEEQLRRSQERFLLAQQAGGVGTWDWDIIAGKTYWSETTWAFYGETPSKINPDDAFWSAHVHKDDRARVKKALQDALLSGSDRYWDEFRIARPDGSVLWIETSGTIVRDEAGRAIRVYGVNLDITRRREIEDRIRQSEKQLRLVTDSMPALISYVDKDERYRFVNQEYTEWFGRTTDDITGRRIREVVGYKAYKNLKPHIKRALAGEGSVFETTLQYRGAGERFVQVNYIPDIGFDGEIIGFYVLVNDLTGRRRAEEALLAAHDELELRVTERTKELAQANELLLRQMEEQARAEQQRIGLLKKIVTIQEDERGRIARDLHDQLGQRLTALRLKIAALNEYCTGDDDISQRVRRLQEISEGLDNEISYLAWELRPSILEEAGLVSSLDQHVTEWSRHSGISAEFRAFGLQNNVIAPDIETNLYRIAQEAMNNAAKHSRANHINVLLERRASELILIVEDDGVGFDVASASPDERSGRGFGLAGMRDRVGLIAGTLEIESGVGKGTAVFARVPVE